mmetsp:Transcript_34804/g.78133  ORF Transcript_34804/g.78133 Transcript_34804/m.78133 type:complete len:156 (+) Transcript_34804:2-469(+)
MLRARLTFDQLLGSNGEYHEGDKAAVRTTSGNFSCSAICGNHVMRAGKHWVTFTSSHSFKDRQNIGLVRPPPGWDDRGLDVFSPAIYYQLQADLLLERTDRWDGDVNFCYFYIGDGFFYWLDWTGEFPPMSILWDGRAIVRQFTGVGYYSVRMLI